MKAFPLRLETRQGCLALPLLFNIELEAPARGIGVGEKSGSCREKHADWKEKSKIISICRWHGLYTENVKESTERLLELINSKVAECKVNRYTYNE